MSKTLKTAAGISLLALAAACASNNPRVQTSVPARGVALSEDMEARCNAEVSSLVDQLKQNPAMASKGIEIRIPSDEYLACFKSGMNKKMDREYLFVQTENPRIYTLMEYR